MKTRLKTTVICLLVAFICTVKLSSAQQQLIHFWDFNTTMPMFGGTADSLGTEWSYTPLISPPSRAADSAMKTGSMFAAYTRISGSNARIVYIRPQGKQTVPLVATVRDSVIDNGQGGATFYSYNGYGYNYFSTSDSGATSTGNCFIRTRNPSENAYAYIYMPTTGFQNIHVNFAITASSSKGNKYDIFQYSTNGGTTWSSIPSGQASVSGYGNARWSSWVANTDSLLVCSATTTGIDSSLWCPISINLTSIASANNNANFMLRWEAVGTSSNGSSGNARYDNFSVLGDSATTGLVAFAIKRQNETCNGGNTGAARIYAVGGTPPYTYSWSSNATNSPVAGGLTTDSAYGLLAGTYTVTVTDNLDNTFLYPLTILQPAVVTPTITSQVNPTCNGSSNGSLTANASGGSSVFTYLWSTGSTNKTISALAAGSYTCTAKDSRGCTGTVSATLTQPTTISTTSDSTTVTCTTFGSASITSVSGGTPYKVGAPYTYAWSTGATTSTASGLGVGTYTCTVKDSNNCTATRIVTVTTSGAVASLTVTNVSCNGGSNGSISATVTGGSPPYTYSWAPGGATTTAISGLIAGAYTLTVTESDACQTSATGTVTQPAVLFDTIENASALQVIHYWDFNATLPVGGGGGDSLGTSTYPLPATVSVIPSANPHLIYSHPSTTASLLDNGSPGGWVNDLHIAGNDTGSSAAGNLFVRSRNPVQGSSFMWYIPTTGYQNIKLDWALSASSGKGAQFLIFSYSTNGGTSWNHLTSAMDTFNLHGIARPDSMTAINTITSASNWYPVHIDLSSDPTVNNNPNLIFQVQFGGSNVTLTSGNNRFDNISVKGQQLSHVTCNGSANDTGTAVVTGGTGPYTYAWSNGVTAATDYTLPGGTNSVTVTDANGCMATATVNVYNPPVLVVDSISVNNGCYNSNNGMATVYIGGGTPPYTYLWSNASVSNVDNNLAPGSYTVVATDLNGCTISGNTTIVNPSQLTDVVTSANVTCFGDSNGSASVVVSGGTTPYKYKWSNKGKKDSVNNLMAGTYTITITDADGCTLVDSAVITQPNQLVALIPTVVNVQCNNGSTGSLTAVATGGTAPYSYSWSNGATVAAINNLTAGTYTVTVTDNNNCTAMDTITLANPALLSATVTSSSNPLCNASSDGMAVVMATGGTGSYTYLWSPSGGTADTANGLTAGSYTVTVTDSNSCVTTAMVTLTAPTALNASITSSSNPLCNGNSNGSATVTASGGTGTYTYSWSPSGGTGSTAGSLAAGTYTVTVMDANSCSTTVTVTLTAPSVLSASAVGNNPLCNGNSNGLASAIVTGGTSPYIYSWTSGGTGDTATSLPAGSYTVTVTDANSCSTTAVATLTDPPVLTASITSSVNPTCVTGGGAKVIAGGGTGPYTYSWAPSGGSADSAGGLAAGGYTVTVTDFNGCTATASVTMVNAAAPLVTFTMIEPKCNGNSNGSITANVTGGTSPYTYSWASPVSTNSTITGLAAGAYTVTVTDSKGCSDIATATLNQPAVLNDSITVTNVSCFGACNGSGFCGTTGGTSPYTYTWSTGATTSALTSSCPGNYTVVTTDVNGCTVTTSFSITQPTQLRDSTVSITDVSCNGGSNGCGTLGVKGGTAPYSYSWSPSGGTLANMCGLTAGIYTVTVMDMNGCVATDNITITQPSKIRDSVASVTNVSCNGGSNGSETIGVKGGTSPYTYTWSPSISTSASASGLTAGNYTIIIDDANGCAGTALITTITQPAILTVKIDSIIGSGCHDTVWAVVTGGTSPYTYSWTPSGTTDTLKGVCSGNYDVLVSDKNGCKTKDSIVLVTGIQELVYNAGMKVYPVPTTGTLYISISELSMEPQSVIVYDVTGRKVMEQVVSANNTLIHLDVSNLSSGTYMLKVIGINGQKIARFTVTR